MDERISELENEKRLLVADLTAPSSEVGDWKVIKNIEYTLAKFVGTGNRHTMGDSPPLE